MKNVWGTSMQFIWGASYSRVLSPIGRGVTETEFEEIQLQLRRLAEPKSGLLPFRPHVTPPTGLTRYTWTRFSEMNPIDFSPTPFAEQYIRKTPLSSLGSPSMFRVIWTSPTRGSKGLTHGRTALNRSLTPPLPYLDHDTGRRYPRKGFRRRVLVIVKTSQTGVTGHAFWENHRPPWQIQPTHLPYDALRVPEAHIHHVREHLSTKPNRSNTAANNKLSHFRGQCTTASSVLLAHCFEPLLGIGYQIKRDTLTLNFQGGPRTNELAHLALEGQKRLDQA